MKRMQTAKKRGTTQYEKEQVNKITQAKSKSKVSRPLSKSKGRSSNGSEQIEKVLAPVHYEKYHKHFNDDEEEPNIPTKETKTNRTGEIAM